MHHSLNPVIPQFNSAKLTTEKKLKNTSLSCSQLCPPSPHSATLSKKQKIIFQLILVVKWISFISHFHLFLTITFFPLSHLFFCSILQIDTFNRHNLAHTLLEAYHYSYSFTRYYHSLHFFHILFRLFLYLSYRI